MAVGKLMIFEVLLHDTSQKLETVYVSTHHITQPSRIVKNFGRTGLIIKKMDLQVTL